MRTTPMMFATALFLVTAACLAVEPAAAQVRSPVVSPYATVSEEVGLTDITIRYGRPAVNGRPIWGGLVPNGLSAPLSGFGSGNAFPWRAGANENTTITFTHPVYINDTRIEAGTYGLHLIPTESEWTFILSTMAQAWGSFSYDESEDAVRVAAVPQDIPHEEYVTWSFENLTHNETTVSLAWEMKKASFDVWVDTDEIVVASLRDGLRGLPRFYWQGWQQAAAWCLNNDTNLDEAMQWIDRSIAMQSNFTNLSVKSGLLEKQGKTKEANDMLAGAMDAATEAELNVYGYQLMGRGEIDRAIAAFRMNTEKHPDSWNTFDSLAEAYMNKGDRKNAVKYYEKALSMVTDETQKGRIRGQLAQLKG